MEIVDYSEPRLNPMLNPWMRAAMSESSSESSFSSVDFMAPHDKDCECSFECFGNKYH
jgi:hypothetical protein